MADETYDLVVIGAGSGGVRAARMAATYGARVAVIEEYRVGGTCVIRGCVPKKLYVYASRFRDLFEVAPSFGWQVDTSFDWPTLVANKNKEIDRLEKAYVSGLEGAKAELIRDRAVIVDPHMVRTVKGGRTLRTKYVLVATGGHAMVPDIAGKELGFTSNEAFDLPKLPHSILIEGGGYVGVEFATIFAGLGVHTTLVYRGTCVLRGFDEDLRQGLDAGLEMRGIRRIYETNVRGLSKQGDDILVSFGDGTEAPFGAVMFATGRVPNVRGFGLEEVGVKLTPGGAIEVDRFSRTSVESIYAVGDVTGRIALTPVAIREGAAVAETLFNNNPVAVDHSLVGTAVFAEPEVSTIGLTEAEALTHGDIDVYVTRFRPMMNTLSDKAERMMLKLIVLAEDQRVLGVHVLGPGAAEMIQMAAIALGMKATKADFDRTFAIHPTAGEELVTFKAPSYRYRNGEKV
ncbi:MAG TPA: glutathione-disulfide reductase [Devosia sp.]|nr:glutathione-disulfide reductase [Devosia sp.]